MGAILLGAILTQGVSAATTDGTATLNVTLTDPAGNYNRRVDAFWITDGTGRFIVTVRKDAASEQAYLYQWNTARGTSTVVDGYSGATITTWTPMSVPWNGRDANNVLVPDGNYRFYAEFTDHNGQGWWTTNGLAFTKGASAYTTNYPALQYLTAMSVTYAPVAVVHDIAVTSMTPSTAVANTTVAVQVGVTNRTANAETFSVILSNATSGVVVGTQTVTSLAGNAASSVTFQWNTAGLQGNYALRATAGPVTGETSTADNSYTNTVAVQPLVHDIAVTSMAPNTAQANTTVSVQVGVTNKTANAESFSVTLSNVTTATLIGTQTVGALAGNATTSAAFAWNTAGLQGNYVLRAVAGPVTGETITANNSFTNTVAVQSVAHDIAVTSLSPSLALPGTNVTITVGVTNLTINTETFSVVLSNLTSASRIGTQQITALAGNRTTSATFQWSTTNLSGNYVLQASAGPVTGETATTDNTRTSTVAVRSLIHDVAIAAINVPALVSPNSTATISVLATNAGETAESFGVQLFDDTDARAIGGTYQVSNLAVAATLNVPFTWSTTNSSLGVHTLRAVAVAVTGETALANNTKSAAVTVQTVNHDVAIATILAPTFVAPNGTATISVVATNLGAVAESFGVQLLDDTDARTIGATYQVTNLAVAAAVNIPFTWKATNSSLGYHMLRAVANPVSGETTLANNTNTVRVAVATGLGTNTYIAKASPWRYNDQGLDLTQTPWRLPDYYDATWSLGAAPLGYSANSSLTNLTTRLSWGPVATNKYPTYYLRREFYADVLPAAMTLNMRCVDGAILYLNGVELTRQNIAWSMGYSDLADAPVTGTNRYTYVSTSLVPTNVVLGRNVLAVELHRADLTGSGLAFDLEMIGTAPQATAKHLVDTISMTTSGSAILGDQLPVSVTVTNRGNVTESVQVFLKNNTTGQIIGSQTITSLVPGGTTSINFDWGTLGANNGANSLTAYTVVGGVTNMAGSYTNTALISGTGFVTNPVNTTATIGGRCFAMATASGHLLVGSGATLEIWDVSHPSSPVRQGAVRLPGLIQDIAATESYAYVACGSAGVQFVDLHSSSQPIHRRTLNTAGNAYSVAVSGSYLYVADGNAGLRIVNISSPSSPSMAGVYYTSGPARAVAVSNSRAYLLDQQQGLLILDVSSPRTPSLLGVYPNFDAGVALAVSSSYAYLLDANNHFAIVNVSTPASPTLSGSLILTNMIGQSIAVNGSRAYVSAGVSGLVTINVSTPSAPTIVSTTAMPGEAGEIARSSSTLYVADGFAGFQVFNVSSSSAPSLQADYPTALRATDVAITNNLAYVAAGESGLRIFSLTNAGSPALLGRFTGAANARAVAVSGSRAYVGDGPNGLKIVNVANPAAPTLLGSYTNSKLGSIRDVGVSGSLVVVSDGRTMLLLDASTSSRPTLVGTYNTPAFAFAMTVNNNRAYVACGKAGLVILNVSRSSFATLGSLVMPSLVNDVSVAGTSAYLSGPVGGWWTVDVSTPSAPHLVQSATGQGAIMGLAALGTNVAVLTTTNYLVTMNASVPLRPVSMKSFGPLVGAIRLAVSSNFVASAEDEAGLGLFAVAFGGGSSRSLELDSFVAKSVGAESGPVLLGASLAVANPAAGTLTPAAQVSPASTATDAASTNANFTLHWQSVAGQTYTVYRSTDLKGGFTPLQTHIPATPPTNVFIDPVAHDAAFYMIVIEETGAAPANQ